LYRPDSSTNLIRSGLDPAQTIAISIADTGIGMSPEQQKIIFEAFQQADGSTSRQYGGTGLGLSISREFALKLGGHIDVNSEAGKGSIFTIYHPIGTSVAPKPEAITPQPLPRSQPAPITTPKPNNISPIKPVERPVRSASIPDDRAEIKNGDKTLLIIEDDPKFAKLVYNHSREHGFKCLIAGDGTTGLELVDSYQPSAIMLDLHLPDMSGWEVLEVLKNDPAKRHTPVHIISADDEVIDAYHKGAMGYLTKPVDKEGLEASFEKIEKFISREIKSLLLVEDDKHARHSIKMLLGGGDVHITEAARGQVALDLLRERPFDCIILDLTLPDMTGFEVLSQINELSMAKKCPVIVYTGRDLSPEENHELMQYADSVIVKGVKSPERLLDETALFLHRVVSDMSQEKQHTIKQLYDQEGMLKDKKVLIVDDDMRNSFALSKLLSEKGIVVRIAANGQKALDLLATESVDLILMDIMMPVMDGYETIRRIRLQPKYNSLPVLALTAKAMKEDREKCLAAGADDYLPKPIDIDRLFSMLRVWLYK
jgi:CheY-like chemotaxis protein